MTQDIYQIALDGPAASGKSTTAKAVAKELGIQYLDTGAMYRAFTLHVLDHGADPARAEAVVPLLKTLQLTIEGTCVRLGDTDVSERIRENRVSRVMGPLCTMADVREYMVLFQRELGSRRATIVDGRDIGTVVFPDARFKFFLVASLEERALRRQRELSERGQSVSLQQLMDEIARRDHIDSTREVGPLKKAVDAVELDTTGLSIEQQVHWIVSRVREELEQNP